MAKRFLLKRGSSVDLMLDSGAYTAFRQGVKLNVSDYVEFIHQNRHLIDTYVNLDVIPGAVGHVTSHHEAEEAAEQGWSNFRAMRAEGLEPIPVFHVGERMYWLERMLDKGCTYIGLGGTIPLAIDMERRQSWYDACFTRICDDRGTPRVRVHGFGLTTLPLLARYPWYSVDSSRWMLLGGYGSVLIPPWRNGEYDYAATPEAVCFTKEGGTSTRLVKDHIDTLGKVQHKYILQYVEEIGIPVSELQTEHLARKRFNARYFMRAQKALSCRPFKYGYSSKGFFFQGFAGGAGQWLWDEMQIILVCSYDHAYSQILQSEGIRRRLLSYHYIVNNPVNLEEYVKLGYIPSKGEANATAEDIDQRG